MSAKPRADKAPRTTTAFMIEVLVLGQTGHFAMSQPLLCELYVVTAFLTVMAYWKHRGNIVRLLHGEERKTYLSSSKNKK